MSHKASRWFQWFFFFFSKRKRCVKAMVSDFGISQNNWSSPPYQKKKKMWETQKLFVLSSKVTFKKCCHLLLPSIYKRKSILMSNKVEGPNLRIPTENLCSSVTTSHITFFSPPCRLAKTLPLCSSPRADVDKDETLWMKRSGLNAQEGLWWLCAERSPLPWYHLCANVRKAVPHTYSVLWSHSDR